MKKEPEIYLGKNKLRFGTDKIEGDLVRKNGELYYKISNYDLMPPFFMSLTSDSDIWMFISSDGGITAGRKNADHALFPYYTDDLLSNLRENTGSKSIFLVEADSKWQLWEPFSSKLNGVYKINRNLYKNAFGNKLEFEEINHDLGLSYSYAWYNSRSLGIIKKSSISFLTQEPKRIRILDGLMNILPSGIIQSVQQTKSNLANAYKKNELLKKSGIGIYSLSSNIIDRPEPSESLRATTVWSTGLDKSTLVLSDRQINNFIAGREIEAEYEVRGEPGAYLSISDIQADVGKSKSWYFVVDTGLSVSDISKLEILVSESKDLSEKLEKEIIQSTKNLFNIVSQTDGFQLGADEKENMRHASNTLFNVMRGGFFADGYSIDRSEFIDFIKSKNRPVFDRKSDLLNTLPDQVNVTELKRICDHKVDVDLERFSYEFLPVTFSRRHGDPSRPWNRFNIDNLKEDGSWRKSYEGNWRDIFQNWEALGYSYPEYIESMITLFLNASTIDGYNPYRITNKGVEWEIADPDDPWSFIGYWGDHQIIYLLKLLETSSKFHPGVLEHFLNRQFYTYSNVPYRIKGYDQIVKNPYDTIVFDNNVENQVQNKVEKIGADGKLVWDGENILKASLTEKLLVTLLAKLSNFVPEGGIWMNTQRPEWNDANNALVGHGLSMVTVYYIYRYLGFLDDIFKKTDQSEFEIRQEVKEFLDSVNIIFKKYSKLLVREISDQERKEITDQLGYAGEHYRESVYSKCIGKNVAIKKDYLLEFIDLSIKYTDQTIRANRRKDNLYHAYNLIEIKESGFGIEHLYPMLEGQVAVLSSGFINPKEAIDIVVALRKSELYRKDQDSYILYPDKELAYFTKKSEISGDLVRRSKLLLKLIEDGDTSIIQEDSRNIYHFNPGLSNAKKLEGALDKIDSDKNSSFKKEDRELILEIYEKVFRHHQFTGRSGMFFGYEGLGSIYWHMNSKLLLAIQENYYRSIYKDGIDQTSIGLRTAYFDIKRGLGTSKNPEIYGAFPTDPYSHTPAHKGAQQPGMTGQVKEDILSRLGELGVIVQDGTIVFDNSLMNQDEFLKEAKKFEYYNLSGEMSSLIVDKGSFAFLFCQVPVIYTLAERSMINIHFYNGETKKVDVLQLSKDVSRRIFMRDGSIDHLEVYLAKN